MTSCLVNPRACHETELTYTPTDTPLRIAVVGAGPGGMMTAIVAAQRGHDVTLFEQADHVGGQLDMARMIPGKEEFHGLVRWFEHELARTGVTLRLGQAAQPGALRDFDEVVIATGVTPRDPGIAGQDAPNVISYVEALRGRAPVGRRVAVVGAGGIGFDVAEFLTHGDEPSATEDAALWRREWGVSDPAEARAGLRPEGPQPAPPQREITLLQRKAEKPGRRLGKTTGWIHRLHLRMKEVRMLSGVKYERISQAGLHVSFGAERSDPTLIEADTIVLCTGQESARGLADALMADGRTPHVIGGADRAAELDAKRAIDQGARLAAQL